MVNSIKLIGSNNGLIELRCDYHGFFDCLCDFNIFQISWVMCVEEGEIEIITIVIEGNRIISGNDNFVLGLGFEWGISEGF